jgi:Na+-driven multidrug efflux pump
MAVISGSSAPVRNAAASNIIRLIYVAMNAFYQATISFTSQNMGAKKYKRINEVFYTALLCTLCSGIVLGVGSYLAGPWLLKLFASSKEVIEIGMIQLAIVGTTYVIGGVMDVIVGSLRGMGCVMVPTIVSIFGVVGTCAIWTLVLFPMEWFHSIEFLNFYYPVSWILTGIVHFITFTVVRKKIKDNRNCI